VARVEVVAVGGSERAAVTWWLRGGVAGRQRRMGGRRGGRQRQCGGAGGRAVGSVRRAVAAVSGWGGPAGGGAVGVW